MSRPTHVLETLLRWISAALALAAALTLSGARHAVAAPMTFQEDLHFQAPSQSLWGPGGSTASFGTAGNTGYQDVVVGEARVQWDFGASSGSVRSDVRGALEASYDSEAARNVATPITLGFASGSSSFSTDLGAHAELAVRLRDLPLGISDQTLCLFCEDYGLNAGRGFTATLGTTRSTSDSFPALGLGASVLVAGIDASLNATQTASFRPDAVRGVLEARHLETGRSFTQDFVLSSAIATSVLDLVFDRVGDWDLRFIGLRLDNTFWTDFGASITATAWYDYLLDSGSVEIPIAALDLLSRPAFALGFGELSTGSFRVTVPEPGTAVLLVLGLAGLALWGRPRGATRAC